ncbi:MAG: sulfatase [Candidatus Brocadiia bacterium]
MKRREFLGAAGAAAAGALAPRPARSAPRRGKDRPNILFAIADDWSWPHAGAYADEAARTPTFDRLAREGVLFRRAYCAAPSCTPSRGAVLTGQWPHRLEEGGNLWSRLDEKFACYPRLLEAAGYRVGHSRKGWGPGTLRGTGRERNPAGGRFRSFEQFLAGQPKDRPFCFWFGSHEPHRGYKQGSGRAAGIDLEAIRVPPFLPDHPVVRSDIADYLLEVQRFDSQVAALLRALEREGLAENTLVVMTSDNGMPFPRAKANLYDYGTHMPLAVRWPAAVPGGREVGEFVSFQDFAPTFLEAAGLEPTSAMTGTSFLDLLAGGAEARSAAKRDRVFVERERHASGRGEGGLLSYPLRAVRTADFLYIRNLEPDRWPACDPPAFRDIDGSPTKAFLLAHREDPEVAPLFRLAAAKRPGVELYDLGKDPGELHNVAAIPGYAEARKHLRRMLEGWMARTADPRARGEGEVFDRYPYFGRRPG